MGVKTKLTLEQAQKLFPHRNFISIEPTHRGVIDTTYKISTKDEAFILKKYERATNMQIQHEQLLLNQLYNNNLRVPRPLESSGVWQLFSYLKGEIPHKISLQHLQKIGSFLGSFHTIVSYQSNGFIPFSKDIYQNSLFEVRKKHLLYSKKLSALKSFPSELDGIIHGDLFCDNTKFEGAFLSVFDFIEAGQGSFAFDLGVVAMSWIAKKHLSQLQLQTLLKAYNQKTKKKITLDKLLKMMHYAALVYSLKRFINSASSLDYKEMLYVNEKIYRFKKLHFYHKRSTK